MKKGILMVVSGFSGSGKGTVVKELVGRYPDYALSVSATTRGPREGEVHGVHYFFISQEEFDGMVERDEFIEHATYVDHSYGTPRKFVEEALEAGKSVLLEIEVQGALQIREKYPNAVLIFLTAPSMAELKERLIGRGSETPEVIAQRLNRAKEEATWMDKYDYILVNDQVAACAARLDQIRAAAAQSTPENLEFIAEIQRQAQEL